MRIKTVIFDLDGTITKPFLDFDKIREEIGLARGAGTLLEAMAKMPEQERERAFSIIDRHEKAAVEQSSLNEGAKDTLEALRKASIKIGVLTRNTRENADAVAKKHGLKFDAVIDRDDGPVKPDGFGVLRLCEHLASEPFETLVVGDYLYDLLSAKAAGAVAVLLKTHENADKFSEYADFTINRLDQVLDIIEDNHIE